MPTTNKVKVEILDLNNVWQDVTDDFKRAKIGPQGQVANGGQTSPRGNQIAGRGECVITMDNYSATRLFNYTPGPANLVRPDARMRIRESGQSLGYCLQAYVTGIGDGAYFSRVKSQAATGAFTTTATSITGGASSLIVGTNGSGFAIRAGQSFQATTGILTQFTFTLLANVGAPSGTMTWEIRDDLGGTYGWGGSVYATGTLTPTASAVNTVNVANGPNLVAGNKYWLVLYQTSLLTAGTISWVWGMSAGVSTYANGNAGNLGSAFTNLPNNDAACTITTTAPSGDVYTLTFQARAQFDYQYNTMSVYMVTDTDTQAWQLVTLTNKWATYTVTFTCSHNGTTVETRFQPKNVLVNGGGSNFTMIELKNIALQKNGGANLFSDDNYSSASGLTNWTGTNVASVTSWTLDDTTLSVLDKTTRLSYSGSSTMNLSVAPDTWISFNGTIDTVSPSPFVTAGDFECDITLMDFVVQFQDQHSNLQAQTNIRSDQVVSLLVGQLTSGSITGSQIATGLNTFAFVFDGYTYAQTSIYQALQDTAISEGGRFWVDRDGTLRFGNQRQFLNAALGSVQLTLRDGLDQYDMHVWSQTKMIVNDAVITMTPRVVSASLVSLGTFGSTYNYYLPSQLFAITPGGSTTITFPYTDVTGNSVGGAAVQPPIAGLDYLIYKQLVLFTDGSGQVNPSLSVDGTYDGTISLTSFQPGSTSAKLIFNNSGNTTYYLYYMQLRGYSVTANDPVVQQYTDLVSGSITNRKITFSKTLPFVSDTGFALSLAHYYVTQFKTGFTEVDYVEFVNTVRVNGVDLNSLELFDTISISDTQSGLSNVIHAIVQIEKDIDALATDGETRIKFTLERLDQVTYMVLDNTTYAKLDSAVLFI